jgi:hypothetical protein
MKLPREAKDAVQPRRPRTGAAWRVAAMAMLAMGHEVKPRRRPRASADVVARKPSIHSLRSGETAEHSASPARRASTTGPRRRKRAAPPRLVWCKPLLCSTFILATPWRPYQCPDTVPRLTSPSVRR